MPSNSGLIFPLHIHYNAIQCQIMRLSKHKYIALIQQPGQEIIFYTPPDCVTMTSQSTLLSGLKNIFMSIENNINWYDMIWTHTIIPVCRSYGLVGYCHIQPKIPPCLNILFIYPEMIFSVLHKIFVISVQCSNGPQ